VLWGTSGSKKNPSLTPEEQIVTANPEITVHDITEEDEFIVIACDGIWDCLSSQQVVDFVRLKVSEGEELSEIGKMLCDHCLAPDSDISGDHLRCGGCGQVTCSECTDRANSAGTGIGCDNMTVVIVAILNGRTKDEWCNWVADRVKERYGYATPRSLPKIYPANRLKWFKALRERQEERDRKKAEQGGEAEQDGEDSSNPLGFVVMADDVGGIALTGGPPSGLRADLFRSSLVALLDRG